MSDLSEFQESLFNQSLDAEGSPYISKKYNFISDLNSSVYTNNSSSLVQIDLSSLFTSEQFIDPKNMYLVIPMVYTAAYTSDTAVVAPTANTGYEYLITPKNGSHHLIQSMEVIVNGESVVQMQPNINFYVQFKLMQQMNPCDLLAWGKTLNIWPDDVHSLLYNGIGSAISTVIGPVGGNGLTNNMIFPVVATTGAAGVANGNQQSSWERYAKPGTVYNSALQERSRRFSQSTGSLNGVIGTTATNGIMSLSQVNNEFRPCFQLLNTSYMTWLDYSIIRLGDVCDFFAQCPLVKGLSALLRFYVNTGYTNITVVTAASGGMSNSAATSTFTNTCPFTINTQLGANVPATATHLIVSCNIARSTVSTALNGVSLSNSAGATSMMSVRCYYPMIRIKDELALSYVQSNRKKEILFRSVVANTFQSITTGSTFNQLIQSGIVNPKGILICPFLSSSTHGGLTTTQVFATPIVPFAQYSSPFDTCPGTVSPISLTQLNVSLGGLPVLSYNYNYTFESFVQELSGYDKLAPVSSYGLQNTLISQFSWEMGYRWYYVSLERGNKGDAMTPRSISMSFLNNSLQTIDIWCFIESYTSKYIDVATGFLVG